MIRLVAIAFLVLFAGSASAQSVRFPSIAVGPAPAGPEIDGWMYRPAGAGPFPGIVLAHTCNGVGNHTAAWGRLLASWGYVVVAPDSFGPRGEKSVCGRGAVVSGNMRVADVAGAMDFLNAQPFVRRGDIGLIGHSHGGWTAVRAVQGTYGLAARGLKAAVAYYPACQQRFDRDVVVPLLVLIGDKDDWTLADDCRKLQAAGFTRPDLVQVVYYPNAYHSFDSTARDRTITVANGKSHRLGYDPSAAPDAEARARAFFARYLGK
ncbi:MAG: dienelactone hydrolase family protein [Reyranella sp.]|uniref:dienelactone hydrolase family protein n=1 Tax=Reyranella sp. TaxID=1929291 RepID=UPI003D10572F